MRPDACRNGDALSPTTLRQRVRRGMTSWQVLTRAGQPSRRLGSRFTYCTTGGRRAAVTFDRAARVSGVRIL